MINPAIPLTLLLTVGLVHPSLTAETPSTNAKAAYPPIQVNAHPQQVYWGDTHLHTNLSFDAYGLVGNSQVNLDAAYRFARGDTVTGSSGVQATINRPLDFLVVAEHAKFMGVINGLVAANPHLKNTALAAEYTRLRQSSAPEVAADSYSILSKLVLYLIGKQPSIPSAFNTSVWESVTAAAERYNDPGQFTAFIGFEWTPGFYNLHRVVIFKDGAERANQVFPFTGLDSYRPEKLWDYMASYEAETGGEMLAIPHNGNLSNGVMFALEDAMNQDLTRDYATSRARWEPLYEVTQTKGDSETHPLLSPDDAFADYERITSYMVDDTSFDYEAHQRRKIKREYTGYDRWLARHQSQYGDSTTWMRQYEYVRSGLKLGLQQQTRLGVNPFKFGLVGGTDAHTGISAADENNFWGLGGTTEPASQRITPRWAPVEGALLGARMNAAGYTGVWAEENTRESLFAAMKRKEVYASTGPRMTVRFFGGWNYQDEDAFRPNLAQIGYGKGVPMGGDLTGAPQDKAPNFLIRAVKDPQGANLDRVQVIKGWHDSNGELHEKIYNVALADGRRENHNGKVKSVGNTVDIADASYTNRIGDPELAVVWQDPDFNPHEHAFYYLRVLEIPTPRWTAYDAKYFDVKDIPDEIPMVTQERAYTSPIWYTPSSH